MNLALLILLSVEIKIEWKSRRACSWKRKVWRANWKAGRQIANIYLWSTRLSHHRSNFVVSKIEEVVRAVFLFSSNTQLY